MDDLSTLISSRLSVSVRIGKVFPAEKREYVSDKSQDQEKSREKREREKSTAAAAAADGRS